MINDFFANIYELFLRHPEFSDTVAKSPEQDYLWLGVFMLIIPILFLFVFYKLWDPSPTKIYKWLVIVILIVVFVFGLSYYWLSTGSLEVSFINGDQGVSSFALTLSLYNAMYCLIVALISSFIIKRLSINNINNPL